MNIDQDGPRRLVSVDVETTGTSITTGDLATVGLVAYDESTLERIGELYVRLLPLDGFDFFDEWAEGDPPDQLDAWDWDPNTRSWWEEQDETVRAEAFGYGDDRLSPYAAGVTIWKWLVGLGGPITFAADPACFDFVWVNSLLWEFLDESPAEHGIDYHAIDLRSMAWALGKRYSWLGDKLPGWPLPSFDSKTPHHALADAEAQGEELVALIRLARERNQPHPVLDEDGLEYVRATIEAAKGWGSERVKETIERHRSILDINRDRMRLLEYQKALMERDMAIVDAIIKGLQPTTGEEGQS